MKIACIDTENSSNVYNSWEPTFYMTCVGVITEENGKRKEDLIWFDHSKVDPTVDNIKKVQDYVDWADLIVMHNAKYDINVLKSFGIEFGDTQLWCTMVSDYLIEGQNKEYRYGLNFVAERYDLGQKLDEVKEMWDNGVDTYDIPEWLLGPYCIQDVSLTLSIYHKQVPRVEEKGLWKVVDLQNEYTYTLADMEYNGLLFNKEVALEIVKIHKEKVKYYTEQILKGVPESDNINLSSPQQLSALLYGGLLKTIRYEWTYVHYKTQPYTKYYEKEILDKVKIKGLGFKPNKRKRKADGYYSVDKTTIASLSAQTKRQREIKKLLVEYSKHAQIVKSIQGRTGDKGLISKVQEDGCLHPSLNQTVAATGRLTSSNPNGQNLPRGGTSPIKKCIVPRFDEVGQVDLSQIEWRAAGWLSQDKTMIHEVNSGVDQHVSTVTDLMEMEFIDKSDPQSKANRNHAKVFNFRMIYGGTEWGFYLDINMPSFGIQKWRDIIKAFFVKYSGLQRFHASCIKIVFKTGMLKLPTGRWFKFNKRVQNNGVFTFGVNQILNYPIQGMAGGDILPLMAVIIRRGMRKMGLKSLMILTVHDSIVFDVIKEEREKLYRLCYNVGNNLDKYIKSYFNLDWNLKLEVEVEAGPTYGEIKYISPESVGA
jgi:DNA polymerase-1